MELEDIWKLLSKSANIIEIIERDGNVMERLQFFPVGKPSVEIIRIKRNNAVELSVSGYFIPEKRRDNLTKR